MEFRKTDMGYYEKNSQEGTLQKIKYNSNTYDIQNKIIEKDALVYLPYGYDDKNIDYNVLYLMHGGGGDADEIFGGVEGKTDLKNILDNMIAKGDIEPLIVVAPTFYYKGTTEALTSTKAAGVLTQNFEHELLKDLIPVIENKFRVKKERENRAFGGFSMGSEATWNIFSKCLEHFKYFLPMSGDCWAIKEKGGLLATEETVKYLVSAVGTSGVTCEEYNIFACVGDDDIAYEPLNTMIEEMKQYKDTFVFADDFKNGNIIYCVAKGGIHTYDYCYQYIYNALPHFFK